MMIPRTKLAKNAKIEGNFVVVQGKFCTVRELIFARVRKEVEAYNAHATEYLLREFSGRHQPEYFSE